MGKFIDGMVLAIEPMINQGTHRIRQLKDGWTILTADGQPSAHFEHNVALVDGKPELLSTFQYIYDALGLESDEETLLEHNHSPYEMVAEFFSKTVAHSTQFIFSAIH